MKKFMEYNFDIESITFSSFIAPGEGASVHKNRSTHGIVFYTGGVRHFIFDDDKTVTVCQNDILYLPKGSNYTVDSQEKGGCYAINFLLFSDVSFEPFKLKAKNYKHFVDLFQDADLAWSSKRSGFQLKCKSLLYDILFSLIGEYEIGYGTNKMFLLIKPAIDYIHSEYTNENIEISRLAKLCDLSESYFRRIFLKKYGTSPIKYINNLKIDRAKELISSDMYSISEAAEAAGFHDDSYFCRKFKEATGMSPSEYKSK